jgi:hypothetical protein
MVSVYFKINNLINVIQPRVDKIQYKYVGVCTKFHVSVIDNGLYKV